MANVYLLCLLVIPVLMIGFGMAFYKYPPKEIDNYYGYRTKRAMKNSDTWIFAQKYSGKIWMYTGISTLILTVIAFLFCRVNDVNYLDTIFLIFLGVQVVILLVPIPFVEHALKEKFM